MDFNHPREMNFSIVASDNPSIFRAFRETACEILPSNLPGQSGFEQIRTSDSLSLITCACSPHIGHVSGIFHIIICIF